MNNNFYKKLYSNSAFDLTYSINYMMILRIFILIVVLSTSLISLAANLKVKSINHSSSKKLDINHIQSQEAISTAINNYLSTRFLNANFAFATQGYIIEMGAAGLASIDTGEALKANQKMILSAMRNQILAAAILRLHDKGLLNINDTLIKFFDIKSNIWKSGTIPEWAKKVSIHHLLTNTSGIADYVGKLEIDNNISNAEFMQKIWNFLSMKSLEFKPGKRYKYSNTNGALISAIIAKVTGKKVENFLQDEFFKPLNMKATSCLTIKDIIKIRNQETKNLLYPIRYFVEPTGEKKPKFIISGSELNLYTNDTIVSNTQDIIKWYRALHSGQLLSTKSYNLMTTKHYQMYNAAGRKSYVGYGIFISKLDDGDIIFYNSGKSDGFRSESGYVPEKNLYFAILSNVTVKISEKFKDQIDSKNPYNQLDIIYFREEILKSISKKRHER